MHAAEDALSGLDEAHDDLPLVTDRERGPHHDTRPLEPVQVMRERRLQAALAMLQSSSTVKQVAYALGYHHDSQFCPDFKRRFGTSPSAHRR